MKKSQARESGRQPMQQAAFLIPRSLRSDQIHSAARIRGLEFSCQFQPWGSAALHTRLYAAARFAG